MTEGQHGAVHLIDAAALLIVGVERVLKHDAVARLHGDVQLVELNRVVVDHADHLAHIGTTLLAVARADEFLMIHAVHPASVESAREGHLHRIHVRLIDRIRTVRQRSVDRLAISLRDGGDVFRRLESAFDLEALDAQFDQLRDLMHSREILGRQKIRLVAEVDLLAIDDHLIRHATRLCALAAIGAAFAQRFAREALARIGNTQRAMHEGLQRHRAVLEALQFAQRQLTREHRLINVQLLRELQPLGRRDRHLRARVKSQVRREFLDHAREAEVLHDHGIHARVFEQLQLRRCIIQLTREDERVERRVSLHAMLMQEGHQRGQVRFGEIVCAQPRIEPRHAKEDRVRSIRDRCACALPVTGGREEFWLAAHGWPKRARNSLGVTAGTGLLLKSLVLRVITMSQFSASAAAA